MCYELSFPVSLAACWEEVYKSLYDLWSFCYKTREIRPGERLEVCSSCGVQFCLSVLEKRLSGNISFKKSL